MENSILIGLSRKAALNKQMEVVASNLANMNTTGFKGSRVMFTEYLVKTAGLADPGRGDETVFVRDLATVRNMAQGSLSFTENPLDVAIDGAGYFAVEGPDGPLYTRNGRFQLDAGGQVVTDQGYPVLTAEGGTLAIPPGETRIAIAADGTVATEKGRLGQLQVARFADDQAMRAVGDGLLKTDALPQPGGQGRVVQHALESSNVEPILELERMIRAHRGSKQIDTMIEQEDGRIKKMIEAYSA